MSASIKPAMLAPALAESAINARTNEMSEMPATTSFGNTTEAAVPEQQPAAFVEQPAQPSVADNDLVVCLAGAGRRTIEDAAP